MAKLGVRTVDEMVGRTDLLDVKEMPWTSHTRRKVDLSAILNNPFAGEGNMVTFDPKAQSTTSSWKRHWMRRILLKKLQQCALKWQKNTASTVDVKQHRPCIRNHPWC